MTNGLGVKGLIRYRGGGGKVEVEAVVVVGALMTDIVVFKL